MTEPIADRNERWAVLHDLEDWLEWPMIVLALAWFGLFIVEVTRGLTPFLFGATILIWALFIADFGLRLFLAPDRGGYLRRNWLTAMALVVPALRVFRVFAALRAVQAARVVRGTRLLRAVSSVNRGIRALGATMKRRGFGYVLAATALVVVLGAAGILGLERDAGGPITTFGTALWWSAMMMTTMGADIWPTTPEGRILAVLLAVYAFTIFGYVAATLATYFVGQDAASRETDIASEASINALREDVSALRTELATVLARGNARHHT
jgi:voltage-gated potassium channel